MNPSFLPILALALTARPGDVLEYFPLEENTERVYAVWCNDLGHLPISTLGHSYIGRKIQNDGIDYFETQKWLEKPLLNSKTYGLVRHSAGIGILRHHAWGLKTEETVVLPEDISIGKRWSATTASGIVVEYSVIAKESISVGDLISENVLHIHYQSVEAIGDCWYSIGRGEVKNCTLYANGRQVTSIMLDYKKSKK